MNERKLTAERIEPYKADGFKPWCLEEELIVDALHDLQLADAEIERLEAQIQATWDTAHEPAKCGHARANWKDPKYGTPEYDGDERCEVCAEIERLREALEFYADKQNYVSGELWHALKTILSRVSMDKGKRARKAIEKGPQ